MRIGPAADGGRVVEVTPERLEAWLRGFDQRHHVVRTVYEPELARFDAADGAVAVCQVPFPPLFGCDAREGLHAGVLLDHALRERTTGVLLARLGGHAAGVFEGTRLVASKVGSRYVHGRNKAGGQSQARFQRRRAGQARMAAAAAADAAARVLLPHIERLDAVVRGGDRRAVAAVLGDPRLRPLTPLVVGRFLDVPDPRQAVLARAPARFRAVRVRVVDPP